MQPTSIFTAEHHVTAFFHAPDAGETIETVTAPDYWAHVANLFQPGSRIELMAMDGSWWAMLLVRSATKTDAMVQVLQYVPLGVQADETAAVGGYFVKWRGPKAKWGVVRIKDNQPLRDGFDVKEQAQAWLDDHLSSMAA